MRILIADDHEVVRRGVRSLLSTNPDLEVCGEAVDGQDAIEQSQKLSPDLILMDVSMPRLNGLEATREIRRILPQTNVLILTQHDSPQMMQQALNAGARGYVVKSDISENLLAGIEEVYRGRLFFDAEGIGSRNTLDFQEILQRSEAFEKALRESEERFRLTFEQAAVGMAHVAENGRWLRVNQKVCEISGYTESELLQMRFQDITHPDDLAADLEQAEKVIKGELDQYSMEKRYIRKNRSVVWVNLTVSAVRDAENKLKYFVAVIEDISMRRDSEEQLSVLLDYQTATMNNMAEGLYTLDTNGLVTAINAAAEQMFGWTGAELLGKKMHNVTHYKHPDGSPFPASDCPGLHVLQHGAVLREQEDCFIRKDGSLMPVVYSASPLLRNGRITGVVVGFRDDTEQRRVTTELQEKSRRQHALSQLADQLHHSTSIKEVSCAALDAIIAALGCDRASVSIRDEDGAMRIAGSRGLSDTYLTMVDGSSPWQTDEADPQPVGFDNIETAGIRKSRKAVLQAEGIGALMSIPLLSKGRLTGEIVAYRNAPHQLAEAEIELGQTIALQIAFGLERQRSAEALRRSEVLLAAEADALEKLNALNARLWGIRSLDQGLNEILAAVVDELVGANKGNIQLLNEATGVAKIAVHRGFSQEFLDHFREVSAEDNSACGRALRLCQPIIVEDVEKDASFAPYRSIARSAGYRAVVSIPLIGTDGAPIGVLSAHFADVHRPTAHELRRLDLYMRQAANFIQRCRMEESLRKSDERFQALAADLDSQVRTRTADLERRSTELIEQSENIHDLSGLLLEAQDLERRRIARELHDSVSQILSGLILNLSLVTMQGPVEEPRIVKALEDSRSLVKELTEEIRTMSYLLYPPMLDECGLAETLRWYIQGLRERSRLDIDLEIPTDFKRPPSATELVIFRIVQEALTNIHRHSGSTVAVIKVDQDETSVSVEIEDRGNGIPPERLAKIQRHGFGVGIRGMRERVRQVQGEMKISSSKNGTKVFARFPLSKGSHSGGKKMLQLT